MWPQTGQAHAMGIEYNFENALGSGLMHNSREARSLQRHVCSSFLFSCIVHLHGIVSLVPDSGVLVQFSTTWT